MSLFFRSGTPFVGTPTYEGERPFTTVIGKCSRCGGAGRSDKWAHTGYVCYQCNGSGEGKPHDHPLYTAEKLEKLNATQAKRSAKKAAANQVAQKAAQEAADARRTAFEDQYSDVLPWLSEAGLAPSGGFYDNGGTIYRDGFLGDMLRRARVQCEWSEAQAAAVRAAYARYLADKAKRRGSQHVASIGERITTDATVEREASYPRPVFNAPWITEEVFITTLRDTAGNALVVKSPNFRATVGNIVTIRATVKEYSEFRGEAQTLLTRVKLLKEAD